MAKAYEQDGVWLKQCPHCKETKAVEGFVHNKSAPDGRDYWCRKCRAFPPNNRRRKYEQDGKWVKQCGQCEKVKEIIEFSPAKKTYDKLASYCKTCQSEHTTRWKQKKIDEIGEDKMREHLKLSKRRYVQNNPEYRNSQRAHKRKHAKENRAQINAYTKRRRRDDPQYRLAMAIRGRICRVLTGKRKKSSSVKLIGCSWSELRQHIESLWLPGMNWENHGGCRECWSLDHILPCELFDLTQESHQHACFRYDNVRPLSHIANITKADRLDDGRRARDLTVDEKKAYLISKGFGHLFESQPPITH